MKDLFLLARIASEAVALQAEYVDSVLRVHDLVPVPSAAPYVAGLFAQRSRVLTLIDCQYFITHEVQDVRPGQTAIVVEHSGQSYGLLVDDVFDVITPDTPPYRPFGVLHAGWDKIGSALLEFREQTYLIVEPERMINPSLTRAA
jgi:purine-binding chemotaxis protein CheW